MTRGTLVVAAGIVLGAGGLIAARHDEKHPDANEDGERGAVRTEVGRQAILQRPAYHC